MKRIHWTRTLSLCLLLCMIWGLAACADSTTASNPTTPADTQPDATVDASPADNIAPTEKPEEPIVFPLAETFTFDYWCPLDTVYMKWSSLSEHPAYIEFEKRTNVSPNYIHPSSSAISEQFSLITASGEYYDVMCLASSTTSLAELYENEIAIDLTDLIPQYMPNYYGFLTSTGAIKDVTTDEGQLLSIVATSEEVGLTWGGLSIRKDFLDDLGLDIPETYDDWDTAMAAMKSAGVEHPLYFSKSGNYSMNCFEAGFEVGYRMYQDNGEAKYGPIEDGFYDYLCKMHEWYENGYINSDFIGVDGLGDEIPDTVDIISGEYGAYMLTSSMIGSFYSTLAEDEDLYIYAVKRPVVDENTKLWSSTAGSGHIVGWSYFLTPDCPEEKISTILSYFDYLYSDEGAELVSWGVQGESFDFDDEGNRYYTDKITTSSYDNENTFHVYGLTMYQTPGMYNDKERDLGRAPEIVDMQANWTLPGSDLGVLPSLTFTAEETETYSGPMNDCNTYCSENIVRFITGERPLSEFDDFRSTLHNFGIDTVIEVYNAALTRYNNR